MDNSAARTTLAARQRTFIQGRISRRRRAAGEPRMLPRGGEVLRESVQVLLRRISTSAYNTSLISCQSLRHRVKAEARHVKFFAFVENRCQVCLTACYEHSQPVLDAISAAEYLVWVGEIGQGFATVRVLVQQPPEIMKSGSRTSSHGSDAKDVLRRRSC